MIALLATLALAQGPEPIPPTPYDRVVELEITAESEQIDGLGPGEVYEYEELTAVELLEQAGWTEQNSDGYRVKDGEELGFALTYRSPLSERWLTVYQEACKKAGIRLELQLLTNTSHWKNVREFDVLDRSDHVRRHTVHIGND